MTGDVLHVLARAVLRIGLGALEVPIVNHDDPRLA
jgi:hypothetical protein